MKKIIFTAIALAIATMTASTFAQADDIAYPQIQQIKDVPPAGDGWSLVGIRRPRINAPFDTMSIEVYMEPKFARNNSDANGKIKEIVLATTSRGEHYVGYKVSVTRDGDWDETEIPLPTTATDIRIHSCSAATRQCWEGRYTGDPNHWVTLVGPPQMVGKYQ